MVGFTRYFAAIIILLLIILFVTIVNSFKILSPTFPEFSDALEKHQGLISLAGLLIVIILFRVGQIIENNNKNAEIKSRLLTACNILSLELTQYKDAFFDNAIMIKDGTNIPYMNGLLNLDGYDSILSSGLLSYLGQPTQDLIKRLYQRIRLHNQILLYKMKYDDIFFLYDQSMRRYQVWLTRVARYNFILSSYENDIKALIPAVEKSIESEHNKTIV